MIRQFQFRLEGELIHEVLIHESSTIPWPVGHRVNSEDRGDLYVAAMTWTSIAMVRCIVELKCVGVL